MRVRLVLLACCAVLGASTVCSPVHSEAGGVAGNECLRLRGGADSGENKGQNKRRLKLRYWRDELGFRVYTSKKIDPNGFPTYPAHPPPFHPSVRMRCMLRVALQEIRKERMTRLPPDGMDFEGDALPQELFRSYLFRKARGPTTSDVPLYSSDHDELVTIDEFLKLKAAAWEDTEGGKRGEEEDGGDSGTVFADYSELMKRNVTVIDGNTTSYVELSMQVLHGADQGDGREGGESEGDAEEGMVEEGDDRGEKLSEHAADVATTNRLEKKSLGKKEGKLKEKTSVKGEGLSLKKKNRKQRTPKES
ncbi:hypothetical protein GUITHDRAFT_162667 [Guillardia theta CCMP2712]|uniref:Uncharacterized protein n=1 Tax=Guillardia theta (strain CCMP2712) TaxID=905079 RepID=L1JGM4_GUITC|nr:hypothetical protein GUITHDRAFT_162667 [Guillardia theta CCMP2712]EKX47656.1 hypothetical protein GUITHDRAFT_162667 [Guillardia theta CCMP2712]|eukprot:XP_005834636.1 hypothetical protein GUITHDRAFT_162667 [Guillardia theta CCMP2712]